MKKHFLLFSLLIISIAIFAEPVDPTRAMQIAQEFVPKQQPSAHGHHAPAAQSGEIVYTHYMPQSGKPALYVVNIGNAFAIVSADDVAHPILGYNYSKSWPTDGNIPPQVKAFFDDLAQQIEAAAEHPQDAETAEEWFNPRKAPRRAKVNDNLPDSVGPLLTTTWDQGQYYNALCPEDSQSPYDGHVLTGCVATAMAQIIAYWGKKETIKTRGTHSYNTDFYGGTYGELSVDFENTTYDFTHMPDALTSESTSEEVNAVAKLIYECGVSVNMMYKILESGAYDVDARAALINFFHCSPNASFAEREYFTDEEWDNMLRSNISAGIPVLYGGRDSAAGHEFICHGYQKDGYFYFNFGWSGFADGWYLTSINIGFSRKQTAILGIVPESTGNVILGQMQGKSTFVIQEPLEFYHLLGHNAYEGGGYKNECNNIVSFISADNSNQVVVDVIDFQYQNVAVFDGNKTDKLLSNLSVDNQSPVVSSKDTITLVYMGVMVYDGFALYISPKSDCRRVSNITSSLNATTIHLAWIENGTSTEWQIEYGLANFAHGEGSMLYTNTPSISFNNLNKFTQYDYYIRSVCGENEYGPWNKISIKTEAPYWQDVITTEPNGYFYNLELNGVEISTAEGFAWWAKNGCSYDAYLTADIDLSGFKWRPSYTPHNIFGQGHVISNVYITESMNEVGLFSQLDGWADNVGLYNVYIHNEGNTHNVGGLCGVLRSYTSGKAKITNCYIKNSQIKGNGSVGGLVGYASEATIINCYANVDVLRATWMSLLVGEMWRTKLTNCYVTGSMEGPSPYGFAADIEGGVFGYSHSGEVSNCYSTETPLLNKSSVGTTIIRDTSMIVQSNSLWTLQTPIMFDDIVEVDLLTALNRGVIQDNDSFLCTWVADTKNENGGFPVFGERHKATCLNLSDVSVNCVMTPQGVGVAMSWNGDGYQYKIRYRRCDIENEEYTYITTTNNPDTIFDMPLGFLYEFNVRALCDDEGMSGWSESKKVIVDIPYWTEVVTSQPEGYLEDGNGNVTISSAEGLAWLAIKVNGLRNQPANTFEGKNINITNNIDLSGYRWMPLGYYNAMSWSPFSGNLDGNGYSILNLYVNDDCRYMGFVGRLWNGSIKNLTINGSVASLSYDDGNIGGIVGCLEKGNVDNCHSYVDVKGGRQEIGGLIGYASNCNVTNCFAFGHAFSESAAKGGLIGNLTFNSILRNCYAWGDVDGAGGGLIGLVGQSASVENCYAIGIVNAPTESYINKGKVLGYFDYMCHAHYVYGLADNNLGMKVINEDAMIQYLGGDITNISEFHHDAKANTLITPVSINSVNYSDLLNALNAWVIAQNDSSLKSWVLDEDRGYPVLGDYYEVSCSNPIDLMVSNATIIGENTIRTKLEWTQKGEPDYWEVLYVAYGQNKESGVIVSAESNPCILTNIPIGHPLDFYVRAVYDAGIKTAWSEPVSYIPDKLRWTEVVTSQPEGYIEDSEGNAYISSPEGLAWLSSLVNGLNGEEPHHFEGKRISILSDIDLSAYRWTTMGKPYNRTISKCEVNGNNHIIRGLYCNEIGDTLGLFGYMTMGNTIKNIQFKQCQVRGKFYFGIIVGYLGKSSSIINCSAEGNLFGLGYVGGLVGVSCGKIYNSDFIGNICYNYDFTSENLLSEVGGMCGETDSSSEMKNNYLVIQIDDDIVWWIPQSNGIITGSGYNTSGNISNCYYKDFQTTLPVTSDYCNLFNVSSFIGEEMTWTLNSPPFINGSFRTDLVEALNAWVDVNNSEGIYRHWVADTENINGGFPIFDPNDNPTPTDINNINQQPIVNSLKLIKDGQILIIRGDKTYTVMGQEINVP